MKKILIIIVALLVFVLPLSAYSVNALNSSHARQVKFEQSSKLMAQNEKRWQKYISNSKIIHSDEFANQPTTTSTSLEQLQNYSQTVIQGTVYNLQKMQSSEETAYTKATIYVNRVLSGDKSLRNRLIYVALDGGIASTDYWYTKVNPQVKVNKQKIFVQNDEFPLPSIGSKIITGLLPNHLDEATDYNTVLRQSGFTIKNSYSLLDPRYNFWVKAPESKKYRLNNPQLTKTTVNQRTKQLWNLTKQINQKYN